jgi:hypothetical protein
MTSPLRVLVEQPTRGKRWVAVAADWPGLERGGKTEDEAVEKLTRYVPRYVPVAKRVRLGSELATQTDLDIIGRYRGVGSTDFWGISFAPSPLDRGVIAFRSATARTVASAERQQGQSGPRPRPRPSELERPIGRIVTPSRVPPIDWERGPA